MAYDPKAENLYFFRRIATGLFDFGGRSRRSEFVVFLAAMLAVGALVSLLSLIFLSSLDVPFGKYLQFLLWIPAISLFVRRLHDQDHPGWLAIIMPALLIYKVYEQAMYEAGHLLSPNLGFPYNVLELILVVAFWALVFWPGTKGENRFGPDPRQLAVLAVR